MSADVACVPCGSHVLLDVRVPVQFAMCSLPGSVNVPYSELSTSLDRLKDLRTPAGSTASESPSGADLKPGTSGDHCVTGYAAVALLTRYVCDSVCHLPKRYRFHSCMQGMGTHMAEWLMVCRVANASDLHEWNRYLFGR